MNDDETRRKAEAAWNEARAAWSKACERCRTTRKRWDDDPTDEAGAAYLDACDDRERVADEYDEAEAAFKACFPAPERVSQTDETDDACSEHPAPAGCLF